MDLEVESNHSLCDIFRKDFLTIYFNGGNPAGDFVVLQCHLYGIV